MDTNYRTHDVAVTDNALDLLDREWLLTNGAGSFAMGSLPGVNTRRYHGLLVAASRPPVGRVVVLSQVLDELAITWPDGEHVAEFSTCLFRQNGKRVEQPHGHALLTRFERGLSVRWTHQWRTVTWQRELILHWRQPAATLRYTLTWADAADAMTPTEATVRLHPMLALRDFHSILHEGGASFDAKADGQTLSVTNHDVTATLECVGAQFIGNDEPWWYKLNYPADDERGQGEPEDLYVPGRFELSVTPGVDTQFTLTATLGDTPVEPAPDTSDRAAHLGPIVAHLTDDANDDDENDTLTRALAIASDDFVVERTVRGQTLSTIIAGYPWFADWGRDTFIALPGLLLETGRLDEARETLQAFAGSIRNGLVPNRFDDYDDDAAHYNTVDASLWFIQAALRYVEASNDHDAWNDWLADACVSIIEAYIAGTDNDIAMTGDGLITAGSTDTQLTWMDAAAVGPRGERVVFTPRHGKAVEINALWYAALAGLAEALPDERGAEKRHFDKLAGRMRRAFPKVFWNDERNACDDHVWTDSEGEDHIDKSIRPNQVFAASLPHSPLPRTRQKQVVELVRDQLLTPFGLRTLPEDDPAYHARYVGPAFERDEAYHQGTVWGWLIGPYAEAVLRVGRFDDNSKAEARQVIAPLIERLMGPGLGQLHEIFEAQPPHRAVGCIAQAWSIAELLRVWRMAGQ